MKKYPVPVPTGDSGRDLQMVMTWIQNTASESEDTGTAFKRVNAPYQVQATDQIVQVDCTTDHMHITLPHPSSIFAGRKSGIITLMKHDASGNTFDVTNPDGLVNYLSLVTVSGRGSSLTLYTDGTDYFSR